MDKDCKDEPKFPAKRKSLSCQIKTKTMFKKNHGTKKRKGITNIHKAMRIPDGIFKLIIIYL